MTARRTLAGFFLRLVVIYAALMAAWPLVKQAYGTFHRSLGDACFSRLGTQGTARFEAWPEDDEIKDTIVHLSNHSVPGVNIEKRMPISSRYTGYMPTVVVISLILATPIPWRRRTTALLLGLVLVHLFILCWLGLSIIDDLSDPLPQVPTHGFLLPGPIKAVVKFLVINVAESVIACAYVAPLFIWLICVFRRKDREAILSRLGFAPPGPPNPIDSPRGPQTDSSDPSHTA